MDNPQKSPPLGIIPSSKTPLRAPFDAEPDKNGYVWVEALPSSEEGTQSALNLQAEFNSVHGRLVQMISNEKFIEIELEENTHFDIVFEELLELCQANSTSAYGTPVHLQLGGRDLSVLNVKRIISLIRSEWSSSITLICCCSDALRRFASQQFRCQFSILDAGFDPTEVPPPPILPPMNPDTLSIGKPIHTGAIIRADGDIIVYGSVPKGAIVEAGGSITVLGGLFGEVHAGKYGAEDAFVLALTFAPENIQITDRRCYVDPMREPLGAVKVSISSGQLTILPYIYNT
jgi:septum formation inhibitor MinC